METNKTIFWKKRRRVADHLRLQTRMTKRQNSGMKTKNEIETKKIEKDLRTKNMEDYKECKNADKKYK